MGSYASTVHGARALVEIPSVLCPQACGASLHTPGAGPDVHRGGEREHDSRFAFSLVSFSEKKQYVLIPKCLSVQGMVGITHARPNPVERLFPKGMRVLPKG